jgi:hypothetical protein
LVLYLLSVSATLSSSVAAPELAFEDIILNCENLSIKIHKTGVPAGRTDLILEPSVHASTIAATPSSSVAAAELAFKDIILNCENLSIKIHKTGVPAGRTNLLPGPSVHASTIAATPSSSVDAAELAFEDIILNCENLSIKIHKTGVPAGRTNLLPGPSVHASTIAATPSSSVAAAELAFEDIILNCENLSIQIHKTGVTW